MKILARIILFGLLSFGIAGAEISVAGDVAGTRTGGVVTATSSIASNFLIKSVSGGPAATASVAVPRYSVWRSLGAMLVVIGGLLALNSYVTKKRGGAFGMRNQSKRIAVLERTALDHRRSLVLVEVDGQRILVGLGPERIEPIAVLTGVAPVIVPAADAPDHSSFSDSLKSLIGKAGT